MFILHNEKVDFKCTEIIRINGISFENQAKKYKWIINDIFNTIIKKKKQTFKIMSYYEDVV